MPFPSGLVSFCIDAISTIKSKIILAIFEKYIKSLQKPHNIETILALLK